MINHFLCIHHRYSRAKIYEKNKAQIVLNPVKKFVVDLTDLDVGCGVEVSTAKMSGKKVLRE
jgi:hypothetical protein